MSDGEDAFASAVEKMTEVDIVRQDELFVVSMETYFQILKVKFLK